MIKTRNISKADLKKILELFDDCSDMETVMVVTTALDNEDEKVGQSVCFAKEINFESKNFD